MLARRSHGGVVGRSVVGSRERLKKKLSVVAALLAGLNLAWGRKIPTLAQWLHHGSQTVTCINHDQCTHDQCTHDQFDWPCNHRLKMGHPSSSKENTKAQGRGIPPDGVRSRPHWDPPCAHKKERVGSLLVVRLRKETVTRSPVWGVFKGRVRSGGPDRQGLR
jgi:hypothetical protein